MENESYTLYDLEVSEMAQVEENAECKGFSELSGDSDSSGMEENSDVSASPEPSAEAEKTKEKKASAAEEEIARMIEDMGAEKLLDIIIGNRNTAIEQIISEVESAQDKSLQSGTSVARRCTSIFDLAAFA